MRIDPIFSDEALGFRLAKAILVYAPEGGQTQDALRVRNGVANMLCSLHDVRHDEKQAIPVLGPGQLLDRATLEALLFDAMTGGKTKRQLLPDRLLFSDVTRLLWWSPARRETIYFSTADKAFNLELTGKVVAHPPLVFRATGGNISVFALEHSARPTLDTPLFVAPYCNLYASGAMCRGDVKLPGALDPSQIAGWERAFFDSRFTHSNLMGQLKMTQHKDGHNGLWRAMRGVQEFDPKYLTPTKWTVSHFLNGETT